MIERKHLKSVAASTGVGIGRHSWIHVDMHTYNTHITKKEKITIGSIKKSVFRAGEMAQQLRAFTALAEDLSSIPSIQVRWLKTTCNSSSRGSDALFWPLWSLRVLAPTPHEINN